MRRVLRDDDGPVGSYERDERGGHVYADLFRREPGVSVDRAARAVLTQLRGMRVAGDVGLGRALVAAGGHATRHGHLMTHDLAQRPQTRELPGYRLTDVDRPAADLLDANLAAYGPGHPDHRDEPRETAHAELQSHLDGTLYGPLLAGSGLALRDETVVGAILLGTLPGDPPLCGPWVLDLFRHPEHPGVGRALLERALALAGGPALGLMVTERNPARRLYEQLGFRHVLTAMVVQI